ncbi:hypothetical protein ACEOPL_25445 [Pseudomonas aeruginosa]|nr:hypothetical protein [Pseudomonas aeruginosa]
MGNKWNFLIFDDDPQMLELLVETFEDEGFIEGDTVCCRTVDNFEEAAALVATGNFDLIILDLQDAAADGEIPAGAALSGEKILSLLKESQFTPVIFNTGFPEKISHLESPFVRISRKGQAGLTDLVREAFSTKLPSLIRYIQEQQRRYLWDHVEGHWKDTIELKENNDVAYLLARRLAGALSVDSIRKFFNSEPGYVNTVHPVEYYIWPPFEGEVRLGDIYREVESESFWLVINPACDLEQCKAENALLVRCKNIKEFPEYSDVVEILARGDELSKTKRSNLVYLIGDNRKVTDGQPERYKFLPGTSFVPDLVVDFQCLSQVPLDDLKDAGKHRRLTTLDSPFAEAVQAKFARYYGRFGVPDLSFEVIADSLIEAIHVEGKRDAK